MRTNKNFKLVAMCILLHAYSRTTASSQLYASWHNRIFGYKLRTIEAENP